MINRKKKMAVVAIATVVCVSVTAMPLPVMAQEDDTVSDFIQGNGKQETAPDISLPENLKVTVGDIEINETNFPDEAFQTWLKQQNYGTDGIITQTEIASITTINVSENNGIKDLTGVEHFTALKNLYCDSTKITSLDVSNNMALESLNCYNTEIESLDVSNNPALESLYCYNTEIESLDISNNPALESLYCDSTKITTLDVSKNTALTVLECDNTEIAGLDISKNPVLKVLKCDNTKITSLDVSKNTVLTVLECNNTEIESLDVSKNTALKGLSCDNTKITSLDISKNTALEYLLCDNTGITSLGVNNNPALERLYCNNTGIESLDVSKNTALWVLICNDTKINSLDVSKNTDLQYLDCDNTSLAYLNIGENTNLTNIMKDNLKPVSLNVKENSTFNIGDKFAGIDKNKVNNVTGADYDSMTGVMSNYSVDTPINYTYSCGTSRNGAETINVTLKLTNVWGNSTISIIEDLNKVYDGTAVNATPAVSKTGSTGALSYKWEQKKNTTNWEVISFAPTDVGAYRVTATLMSDTNYKDAVSDAMEFTIAPKNIKDSQIIVSEIKNDKDVDNLVVKDGDKVFEKGMDYDVTKTQDGNKVTIEILFKGNYTGVITKTYTIAKDESNVVQTRDTTCVGLWSALLIFAGAAVFLKRKNQKRKIEE